MERLMADVHLDGEAEVVQLAVNQASPQSDAWESTRRALAGLSSQKVPLAADHTAGTLQAFMRTVGALFGKDSARWDRQGKPQVVISEKDSVRTITKINTLWGTESHLWLVEPYYDPELTGDVVDADGAVTGREGRRDYSAARRELCTEAEWQDLLEGAPRDGRARRRACAQFLSARIAHTSERQQRLGLHGLWELAVKRDQLDCFDDEILSRTVALLESADLQVAQLAAAVLWGLAPAAASRRYICALQGVLRLHGLLSRTCSEAAPDAAAAELLVKAQSYALGALGVLLVDARCRSQMILTDPGLAGLLRACAVEGLADSAVEARRRITAAKIVASAVQRDANVRRSMIQEGGLARIIEVMEADGPGKETVSYCMASALATLVLDEDAMTQIKDRGEAPHMFVHCIEMLKTALAPLERHCTPGAEEAATAVRMAEAAAQAMWGSAYYCTLPGGGGVLDEHVISLGEMGITAWANQQHDLGRVAHCIAATIATLAANAHCAQVLMTNNEEHGVVATLMLLVKVQDRGKFTQSGHVRAAAATALSFLACHNMGARGDECLTGPYREELLRQGVLDALLEAALTPPADTICKEVVEHAASVGVMYLSTMAGDLDPAPLVMLATLLSNNRNLPMVENLMAAVWILLKQPHNRKVLGTAFDDNPVLAHSLKDQMKDVVDIKDVEEYHGVMAAKRATLDSVDSGKTKLGAVQAQGDAAAVAERESRAVEQIFDDGAGAVLRCESVASWAGAREVGKGEEELGRSRSDVSRVSAPVVRFNGDSLWGEREGGARSEGGALSKTFSFARSIDRATTMQFLETKPSLDVRDIPGAEIDIDAISDATTEDWGLAMLVKVGESWLDDLLNMDPSEVRAPLLKLFEFLMASLCLFLIDDEQPLFRRDAVYDLSAPVGVHESDVSQTWWTVAVPAAPPPPATGEQARRAYDIITAVLSLQTPRAWKIVQLAINTLWNITARDRSVMACVMEKGLGSALHSILGNESWPHSVRDLAAGLLASLFEVDCNVSALGGLPRFMRSQVVMLQSKVPLLESRGARSIARALFAAPEAAPAPAAHLQNAKTVAAAEGAAAALIRLVRVVMNRFVSVRGGRPLLAVPNRRVNGMEDDPAEFERTMTSRPAVVETLHHVVAALLNLSTLKANQVIIAKRGLETILGAHSLLLSIVQNDAPDPRELRCSELLSSLVQNLTRHPDNRTRFYRAELRGTLALQQELLGLHADAAPAAAGSCPQVPLKSILPPLPKGGSKPAMWKPDTRVLGGDVTLHRTIDSCAAKQVRPKGVFAPDLDSTPRLPRAVRADGPLRGSFPPFPSAASRGESASHGESASRRSSMTESAARASFAGPSATYSAGDDGGGAAQRSDRDYFLEWAQSTFQGALDVQEAEQTAAVRHFKNIDAETGEWKSEKAGFPLLVAALRRPLCHIWDETSDSRKTKGQERWAPAISEYHQAAPAATAPGATPDAGYQMNHIAARLLRTEKPQKCDSVLHPAAEQLHTAGRVAGELKGLGERPGTRERQQGRTPLTVLKPEVRDGCVLRQPDAQATDPLLVLAGRQNIGSIPLKVKLAPQRARTVISFEDKLRVESDGSRPALTIFGHHEGSRVYDGLFPKYQLPNGQTAFYYYKPGGIQDEEAIDAAAPPHKPNSVPGALQQSVPLANVLDKIAKPPGSAPPFIPYKPVPHLVPLPRSHTLSVKRPADFSHAAYGDLREDNIQFCLVAKRVIKTVPTVRTEDIEVELEPEKEPWTLPMSIFKPRAARGPAQADAKDYFDNARVMEQMFEKDWQRLCAKEKFTSMLLREFKADTGSDKTDEEASAAVRAVFAKHYRVFVSAFIYYATSVTGSSFHMSLNNFSQFVDDCKIPDNESQGVKRSDIDTIHIVANFQADKKAPEARVNDEHALMRFEFMEAITRVGIAKYGKGIATSDPAAAVSMLFELNILPNLPLMARVEPNSFRTNRLYTEEVDAVLKRYKDVLSALYSRWRLRPPGGGLRTKVLKSEGWMKMLDSFALVDERFTLQDGMLAYMWARMAVADEVRDFYRYESLTFIDFLEALGLVADMTTLPEASQLDMADTNVLEWQLAKIAGDTTLAAKVPDLFNARPSAGATAPKARPLYAKLELLLELICRRVCYDPLHPKQTAFTMEQVIRTLKKQDKDLGS